MEKQRNGSVETRVKRGILVILAINDNEYNVYKTALNGCVIQYLV